MHASMKVRQVSFEPFTVSIPRATVYPGCRIALECEIRQPQHIEAHVVEQGRETYVSVGFHEVP